MQELLDGPSLMDRLKVEIQGAREVHLAVAFWGKGAREALGLLGSAENRLICNLLSGGTNPMEIRQLLDDGFNVKMHNFLHAKIGIVGESFSFVGSSNLSANGLGYEDGETNGWEEANCAFPQAEAAVKHRFDSLWESAEDIEEGHLEAAETAWRNRQKGKRPPSGYENKSLIAAIKNSDPRLEAHNAHIVVYRTLRKEEELLISEISEEAKSRFNSKFDVYWDWSSLPEDAILIDFRKASNGRLVYNGLWRRDPQFEDLLNDRGSFQVAYNVDNIDGATFEKDIPALRDIIARYISDQPENLESAHCFPIRDLKAYL